MSSTTVISDFLGVFSELGAELSPSLVSPHLMLSSSLWLDAVLVLFCRWGSWALLTSLPKVMQFVMVELGLKSILAWPRIHSHHCVFSVLLRKTLAVLAIFISLLWLFCTYHSRHFCKITHGQHPHICAWIYRSRRGSWVLACSLQFTWVEATQVLSLWKNSSSCRLETILHCILQ